MKEEICLKRYASQADRSCVHNLLSRVMEEDRHLVSVYDGEEWTLKKSDRISEVKASLATTGEDTIKIEDRDGKVLGSFYLIYNDGSSSMETIADHTDSPYCNRIWNYLDEKLG